MSRAGALAGVAALVLALVVGMVPGTAAAQTVAPPPPLTVSLTFDDGFADQTGYLQVLQRHGLVGTFYVNTGDIGQPNYLTRADLGRIAAAGDEVGGHTVSHANLVGAAPDETARQICDDRATLASWGFDPVSFAYPYGAYDPAVEAAARDCGYTSARQVWSLGVDGPACPGCVAAEEIPPADPYALRTVAQVGSSTTLGDLEQAVRTARDSGTGWVPFIFHRESCDNGCGNLSSDPALLDAFASWLADQQQAGTVAVRTVGQVIARPGGPARPAPAATSTNVANGDLTAGSGVLPDCWQAGGFGTNTATYRWTPVAGGQPASETVAVTAYTSGDATMLPRLDLGQCSPTTAPGLATTLAARYRSTVPTQWAVYRRTSVGFWEYWTSGPWLAPTADWASAAWTTPPAPPDTTGVAAGLTVGAVGSVTSTGYAVTGGPAPPAPSLAASIVPSGVRGLLVLGALVAVVLGLLGAAIGLVHHSRRRRRPGADGTSGPGAPGPDALPSPRPARDDDGPEQDGSEQDGSGAKVGATDESAREREGGP